MVNDMEGNTIFEHCVFSLIQSRDLAALQIDTIRKAIETNAGSVVEIERAGSIGEDVTHIISTTSDFPQFATARDAMITVVKPQWISQSLMRNKQAPTRPFNPDPKLIFSDITVTCADLPQGDKDAIIGGVLAMGGMESSSLTKLVTHVCALSMDSPKCKLKGEKDLKCKIVLPHWFDDCLKIGKRIDEGPYELPDPKILRADPDESVPIPDSEDINGASIPRPETLPISTDSPRRLDVFYARAVMLSEDLKLGSRLRKILEELIVSGGGQITTSVHSANMYVCHWREGRDYIFACRAEIDVGNLSWLYHLITHNEWTSPYKRLLHYPIPTNGIPGFENFKITLSNYGGDTRIYLENLVLACGAEFTKSMKQDNSHVITARKSGEKCNAADEWNINMVNHLWIEESYALCQVQRLTDPRYTHFPPRTNLGEVIGQTQLDRQILEDVYFPRSPTPSPNDPKPLRRAAMQEKDRNLSASRESEDNTHMDDRDDNDGEEEAVARPRSTVATKKPRLKAVPAAGVSTPIANRRINAGKENDTPSSTNSRSAKNKAMSNLQGLASDIALYEKERKRKGAVWGGERAMSRFEKQRSLDRSSSPAVRGEEEQYSGDDIQTPKRLKTGLPEVSMRLLVTGYKDWVDNPTKEDFDKKKLRELGIHVVQDPTKCTHLAAPSMVRTKKFLCALAMGPTIVRSDFIDACVKKGEIPKPEAFALKDAENEKKFNLKLKDVLVRAKANKRSLFRRVPLYCTAEIPNGFETYRDVVLANGGTLTIYRGRPVIKKVSPEEDVDGPEPVYLITGQKAVERKLWDSFTKMAEEGNMIPRIVTTDWLLDVAMAHQLKWDEKYLAPEQ